MIQREILQKIKPWLKKEKVLIIHFNINRVSFKEYFNYREGISAKYYNLSNFKELDVFFQTLKSKLELSLSEYLSYGGYPEVLTTQGAAEKEEALKSIIKTYIDKDIINQLKVENVTGFNNLIKILADQIGKLKISRSKPILLLDILFSKFKNFLFKNFDLFLNLKAVF